MDPQVAQAGHQVDGASQPRPVQQYWGDLLISNRFLPPGKLL